MVTADWLYSIGGVAAARIKHRYANVSTVQIQIRQLRAIVRL